MEALFLMLRFSSGDVSAVHSENLTGDERRSIPGQIEDGIGDFFGRTDTA